MTDHLSFAYEERIVAFIDIIGFRSLVSKLPSDPLLHAHLHAALSQIKTFKSYAGDPSTAQKELEASVFSDSIVITAQMSNLFTVLWTCLGLQTQLLALGTLTRGGVSHGLTHHKEDVLYGEGMIKAYDLESKAAIYPRIVIDPELVNSLPEIHRLMLLNLDVDGLWHTDPFAFGVLPGNSDDLVSDGYDPHLVFLEAFEKRVAKEMAEIKEPAHLAKWGWMKSKVHEAILYHKKNGQARMWAILKSINAFDEKEG